VDPGICERGRSLPFPTPLCLPCPSTPLLFRRRGEGAYSAPPDTLAVLRGPTSKEKGRGGTGERERGNEREGPPPPFANSWIHLC